MCLSVWGVGRIVGLANLNTRFGDDKNQYKTSKLQSNLALYIRPHKIRCT